MPEPCQAKSRATAHFECNLDRHQRAISYYVEPGYRHCTWFSFVSVAPYPCEATFWRSSSLSARAIPITFAWGWR